MRFERTVLPGIGLSQRFTTANGERVGIVAHVSGRRDLVVYDPQDRETAAHTVVLEEAEAHAVARVLDAVVTVDHLTELERQLPGVSVVRIPVRAGAPGEGHPLDGAASTEDPTAVLAVIRDGRVQLNPATGYAYQAGDEVVAAGSAAAVAALADRLAG